MSTIDNHESLETLATHLVHEDCAHCVDDEADGHCYECTLEHLKKEFERCSGFVYGKSFACLTDEEKAVWAKLKEETDAD